MRRLFLITIILSLLTGCGVYNFVIPVDMEFVIPDDAEFIAMRESLKTPEEILTYMRDNFVYAAYGYTYTLDPYTLWKIKEGDCDDLSNFAVFIANYHGYSTWQITLFWDWNDKLHRIAVFKEGDLYSLSSNLEYQSGYTSIADVLSGWIESLERYIIYDYRMTVIEDWHN